MLIRGKPPSPSASLSLTLLRLLRCPVCLRSPTDAGAMLVCANGHTVCADCKHRLKMCPVARCRYDLPARRNRTAEDVAAAIALYLSDPERARREQELAQDEEVECMSEDDSACSEATFDWFLSASDVMKMIQAKITTWSDKLRRKFKDHRPQPPPVLRTTPFISDGHAFRANLVRHADGLFYAWVDVDSGADLYNCRVECYPAVDDDVDEYSNPESEKAFVEGSAFTLISPVCPVREWNESAEKVVLKGDCFRLSAERMAHILGTSTKANNLRGLKLCLRCTVTPKAKKIQSV